jgi:hypothetical protein
VEVAIFEPCQSCATPANPRATGLNAKAQRGQPQPKNDARKNHCQGNGCQGNEGKTLSFAHSPDNHSPDKSSPKRMILNFALRRLKGAKEKGENGF